MIDVATSETAPLHVVLIVNVGANDIKYWRRNGSSGIQEERLAPPRSPSPAKDSEHSSRDQPKTTLRQMHELLLRDELRASWRFADMAEAENGAATGSDLARLMGLEDCLHDENGRMLISAAKVAPIVTGLKALQEQRPAKLRVIGIAVVHTERANEKNEPIASGPLILEYLGEQLGCGPDRRRLVNAIREGRLEGRAIDAEDLPARRQVAHWIDKGLSDFLAQIGEEARHAQPVVLSTGTMAPVKDLIRAVVALRFTRLPRDLSIPEPEGRDSQPGDPSGLVEKRLLRADPVISRQEALEARGRALYLVRRGDFPGAWTAVSQFADSRHDAWWIHPLRAVARYFGGAPGVEQSLTPSGDSENAKLIANSLRELALNPEINDCIEEHRRFALNVAMRLEAALQGPDTEDRRAQQALFALSTLIDVLTTTRGMMAIRDREVEELKGFRLDQNTGEVEGETGNIRQIKRIGFLAEDHERRDKPLVVTSNRKAWHRTGKPPQPRSGFECLRALDEAMRRRPGQDSKSQPNLRSLRNSAAHRALRADEIDGILVIGEHHGIWRLSARDRGGHALAPAVEEHSWLGLVDAALRESGIDDAAVRYKRLVGGLEALLLEVEPTGSPAT